ncbi:MAG: hypothetical protein KIT26_12030 [Nitrosomonas sp.]|nr:hypothetical protein [Nitrosomonas sp.]
MELLTIARRADFGYSLSERFKDARSRLQSGCDFAKVIAPLRLNRQQQEFYEFSYLAGLVSVVEALILDLAKDFLLRYPGYIKEKTVSLVALAENGSISAILEDLAAKTINDWSYKKFPDFTKWVVNLYDKKATIDDDMLARFTELKATRDLYIHGKGEVNYIYLSKAGEHARETRIGWKLPIGEKYLRSAEQTVEQFFDGLQKVIPQQMQSMGRASVFEAMWNATCLSTHVPFHEGWTVESEDMVRPNDEALRWAWSHSEQVLLDFFLAIYSSTYPGRQHDAIVAMKIWSPNTNEGKVIMSWFDSPFWF